MQTDFAGAANALLVLAARNGGKLTVPFAPELQNAHVNLEVTPDQENQQYIVTASLVKFEPLVIDPNAKVEAAAPAAEVDSSPEADAASGDGE